MTAEVKNSAYQPYYESKQHAWKNPIYFSPEEIEYRVKKLALANHMLDQLVKLLDSKDVDSMTIRQVLVQRIEQGTLYDAELHDFDKKVILDCRAKFRDGFAVIGAEEGNKK